MWIDFIKGFFALYINVVLNLVFQFRFNLTLIPILFNFSFIFFVLAIVDFNLYFGIVQFLHFVDHILIRPVLVLVSGIIHLIIGIISIVAIVISCFVL